MSEPVGVDEQLREELAEIDALPAYLTHEETWTFLRLSERALYYAFDRGELVRRRIGGRSVVPRSSVRAWVLRQAVGEPAPSADSRVGVTKIGSPTPNGKDGPT